MTTKYPRMAHAHVCPVCQRGFNCIGIKCAPFNGVPHKTCAPTSRIAHHTIEVKRYASEKK